MVTETHDAQAAARRIGESDGAAAASWYFDGDTAARVYAGVLSGIESGDPLVLDTLPWLDLSGEWADGRDQRAIIAGIRADAADALDDDDDALIDAYRNAYDGAVLDAVETTCHHHLGGCA